MRVAVDPEGPLAIELGAAGRLAAGRQAALIVSGGGGVSDVVGHAEILVEDLLRVLDALDDSAFREAVGEQDILATQHMLWEALRRAR